MTTIYDVARVSTATVSRVLRGSELVRADTRQRMLGVIEAHGFIPDAPARGLSFGTRGEQCGKRVRALAGKAAVARQTAFEQAVAATPDSGIDQVIHDDFSCGGPPRED